MRTHPWYTIVQYVALSMMLMFTMAMQAQEPTVTVSPNPVKVGDQANYNIQLSGSVNLKNITLPMVENLTWYKNISSSGTSIINGVVSHTRSIAFSIAKEGDYIIPPLELQTTDGKKIRTAELKVKVVRKDWGVQKQDGTPMKIEDLIFAKASFAKNRTEFYVGEEIPVTVKYYVHAALSPEPQYPEFVENPDISVQKIEDPRMGQRDFNFMRNYTESSGNEIYKVWEFTARIRALKNKDISSVRINGAVQVPEKNNQRDFRDDFFGGSFHSTRMRQVNFSTQLPKLTLNDVPKPERDVFDLGILGNYKMDTEITQGPYRVGEFITLDVMVSPEESRVKAPNLECSGFRTFPPEISAVEYKGRKSTRIRYVLVPLVAGEQPVAFKFAFFNPLLKKYTRCDVNKTFKVEANPLAVAGRDNPTGEVFTIDAPAEENHPQHLRDILYLKPLPQGATSALNLWEILLTWGLPTLSVLTFLTLLGMTLWRNRYDNDPNYQRCARAMKNRSKLIKEIKNAQGDAFDTFCRTTFMDWLCDALRINEGSSTSEVCEKLKNDTLIQTLKEIEMSTYIPGGIADKREQFRATLLKTLKKLSFVLVFAFGTTLGAQAPSDSPMDATGDYDAGQFEAALSRYAQIKTPSAPLYYNIGNCFYQMQKFPEALVMYETARTMQPGDADILNNLNATCRKLNLSERGQIAHPLDLIRAMRDSFSISFWHMLAGIAFSTIMITLGICFYARKSFLNRVTLPALILFVGALLLGYWQTQIYTTEHVAFIRADRTPVWSLSVSDDAKELATLPKGYRVEVKERRKSSTLIQFDNTEGWVKNNQIYELQNIQDVLSPYLKK